MWVSGRMARGMAKEHIHGLMEKSILLSGRMTRGRGREHIDNLKD